MSRTARAMTQLFRQDTGFYTILKPGAVFLGVPSLSSGAVLEDRSGNGNPAEITPDGEFSNHGVIRRMLKGNGTRYAIVPIAVGLDETTFTVIVDVILPTHSADGFLVDFFVNGLNDFRIKHNSSNIVEIRHSETGTANTANLPSPENERILIQISVDGNNMTAFCFHKSGFNTIVDTYAGSISGTFGSLTIGDFQAIGIPIQTGTYLGLLPLYNVALTENDGQAMYDQLMGRTLGANLVVNGDFSADTNWSHNDTGASTSVISGGVVNLLSPAGDFVSVAQVVFIIGLVYSITFEITRSASGSATIQIGAVGSQLIESAVGVYTFVGVAVGTNLILKRTAGTTDIDITIVSAKQVTNTGVLAPKVAYTGTISNDSVSAEAGYPDMDLQYRLTTLPTSGTYGFYARWIDVDNNIRVSVAFATGVATLYERDTAVETALGTGGTFSNGDLLRVVLSATQITVYENGTEIITNVSSVGLTEETIVTDTGDGVVTVTAYDTFGV